MTTKPLHALVQEARARLGQEGEGKQSMSASDLRQKLMEVVETKQILAALKELEGKPEQEQLNILEKLGINFGVVTEAAKAATDTYRSLFQDEREARREAARIAEAEKERADLAQIEVLKLLVQGLSETQKQAQEQQAKLLEEVRNLFNRAAQAGPGDPFTDALRQVASDLIKVTLGKAMQSTGDGSSPHQQLLSTLELVDTLEKRVEQRLSKTSQSPPTSISPRDWLELEKIKMQVELEKEKFREELRMREQQMQRGGEFVQVLRDGIAAFMEYIQSIRGGGAPQWASHEPAPQPPPAAEVR